MRKKARMILTAALVLGLALTGCDTGTGGGGDTTPPADVSGLHGTVGNRKVTLSWTDPADADLASIEITWTAGSGGSTSVAKGTRTANITGLTNNTAYTFTVKAVDAAGNKSGGVSRADLTPFVVAGDVAAIGAYLTDASNASKGTSAADPIPLPVSLALSSSNWADLLTAIETANKFAALDLSSCTMSGTEFDPGTAAHPGESKVVSLVLPDAATSIKAGTSSNPTFKNFTALTGVSGARVETVGEYAFRECTSLQTVSLPKAITIGNFAFNGCKSLETIDLPAATTIGENAFRGCTSLETVSLPAATTIGNFAFNGCKSLETIDLPATLTTISISNPFAGCTKLTTIRVAAGNPNYKSENGKLLNKAGDTLIAYPSAPATVTLSSPITTIGIGAFALCDALETVNLPAATTIGEYTFQGCTSLKTVSLPKATTIGEMAFSYCESLETVSLPAATTIGEGAFYGCDSLQTIDLPAATTIGDSAFYSCDSLETLNLPAAPPTLGSSVFMDTESSGALTIHVPSGKVAAYTTAWGVSAETAAGGNTARYGEGHKRIVITAP